MICKDAIDLLLEYVEDTLGATAGDELEQHLRDCAPCQAYLNTYRRTRELTGKVAAAEMPEEMKARLREFLLRRLTSG